ncbi:aldehyde dehydrogenase family protein [Streptomyces sp. NPDC048473]|uniref:aldehyde dehydrogenase family protein n=1 Tax=unclassified Streptomyces TaxID=2593676 RepID=UPI00371FC414
MVRRAAGCYIALTIITGVSPDAKVAQEEIFGPVLTVLTYRDEEEAIRIANHTEFGLSGAVYSTDTERALRVAQQIHAGTVNLNNGITVDIGVPFGADPGPSRRPHRSCNSSRRGTHRRRVWLGVTRHDHSINQSSHAHDNVAVHRPRFCVLGSGVRVGPDPGVCSGFGMTPA